MILRLTDVSSEPLHLQIRRQIRAFILNGELQNGAALPSIRGLAKQERVSVITVQRAYDDLQELGLIEAQRGRGFFVKGLTSERKISMAQERLQQSMNQLLSAARAEGLTAEQIAEVFEAEMASARFAATTDAEQGDSE